MVPWCQLLASSIFISSSDSILPGRAQQQVAQVALQEGPVQSSRNWFCKNLDATGVLSVEGEGSPNTPCL